MKKWILIVTIGALFSCTNTNNEVKINVPSHWKNNATIYDLNVRQFSEKGDFNSILPHLSRLKSMGVKIIWLMPIHPIGELNRKGSLGSYYSVKDYKEINPEFGNKEDFKVLVDSIHELDMKIIIDWVANHTSFDNAWSTDHKDWYTLDSNDNLQPPLGTDWWDVADLNYENNELRNAMTDALLYWINEFDIDGYRCDVASWVPDDYWKSAIDTLKQTKDVFMLAEAEGKNLHDAGFDMTYNWSYMHVSNEIAKGNQTLSSLDSLLMVEDSIYNSNDIRMYFTTNHDENSWNGTAYERYGASFHVQTLLAFTMPGMPLIYNGQESGLNKRLRFFEKDTIEWGEYSHQDYFTKLYKLRIENSAMWNGDTNTVFEKIDSKFENLFAFRRKNENDQVTVLLNFNKDSLVIENYKELGIGGYSMDYMEGKIIPKTINIPANNGKIYID